MPVLTLRAVRQKIRGAQKTRQITKTMQMVSASRLMKTQEKLRQAKPYAQKMEGMFLHLLKSDPLSHPFCTEPSAKEVALVVVTSDRGLCGSYNTNLIAQAEEFLHNHEAVSLVMIGKKGANHFRRRPWPILLEYPEMAGKPDFDRISEATRDLTSSYLSGKIGRIYLLYTRYISALSLRPTCVQVLPLPSGGEGTVQTIIEPDRQMLLDRFLPQYIASRIYILLLEAAASENSARMIAMKSATDNAKKMISGLTLVRNKVRQAAITREMIEIVTAGEALGG